MKLGDICEIKSGYQGQIEKGDTYKLIKLKDVTKDGIIYYNDLEGFDSKKPPKKFLLNKGDIIIKARSTENTAVTITKDLENLVVTAHYMIIKIKEEYKEKIKPVYLELYINSEYAQSFLKRNSEGTFLPIIKLIDLKDLPVKIVPLETQDKLIEIYKLVKSEKMYMQELMAKRDEQYTAYLRKYLD